MNKRDQDVNTLAKSIADQATGQKAKQEKNPAAVALGKLGGLKGGPARAKALSKNRRSEIAKGAAIKRWSRRPEAKKRNLSR